MTILDAPALLDASTIDVAPGRAWTLEWTARVDQALSGLLEAFTAEPGHRSGGLALVALGSYARRSLCPRSDIDLLILHDGWNGHDLEDMVQAICYPLWDAGLSVGHAVRTTKEAVKAAGDRVDTATAVTERRLVAGNRGMADDLAARVTRWLKRAGGKLATELTEADAERHRRHGSTAGALEPELKDGTGGLRDLHSLRWAGAILLGDPGLDPLVGARYLGAADRSALAAAGETLLAARCALHLVGDRSIRNQLRLDLQDDVAAALGMADGDALLREVGLATRTIAHLHARTWPVLLEDARRGRRRRPATPKVVGPDLTLVDGLVEVDVAAHVADDPSLALRAAAAAAVHRTVVGRRSAVRLQREVEAAGSLAWDQRARDALLELLRAGAGGLPAMADADYLGVLEAYLPEWGRVRGRPQRNPLHTFDLDTHLMQASAWLASIVSGDLDEAHAKIFAEMEDPDALVLGTWLHDVGKAWPGDHSVSGEAVARDWVLHMGFSQERADRVAGLIRHHLLLPDVATQRDIDDPDEVEQVAVTIGNTELLDGLFLLGFADSRATGKPAWSTWKDLLVTRLHHRLRRVLEGEALVRPSTPQVVIRAAARRGLDEELVRTAVDGLPKRYLRVASADQIAAHARLLDDVTDGLHVDVREGPAEGVQILSIAGPDRRGMVADCLGVLAVHKCDVLEARVFTHADGTALDWFVVRTMQDRSWDRIVPALRRAYAGEVELDDEVEKRERQRDARPPLLAQPVPITVLTRPSGSITRLEVRGPDSPGVLYRLTRTLSELGVSLLGARVATLGPEVRDSFFVRGDVPDDDALFAALVPAFETPAA